MGILTQPKVTTLTMTTESLIGPAGHGTGVISMAEPWASYKPRPRPHTMVIAPFVQAAAISCDGIPQKDSNMGYIAQGRCYEGQKVTTLARVMLPTSGALTKGTVTGDAAGTDKIKLRVYDLTDGETQVSGPTSLATTDVVFDALQLSSAWTADSTGFNFSHEFDGASAFTEGGHRYRLEYAIETDEGNVYVVAVVTTDKVFAL